MYTDDVGKNTFVLSTSYADGVVNGDTEQFEEYKEYLESGFGFCCLNDSVYVISHYRDKTSDIHNALLEIAIEGEILSTKLII